MASKNKIEKPLAGKWEVYGNSDWSQIVVNGMTYWRCSHIKEILSTCGLEISQIDQKNFLQSEYDRYISCMFKFTESHIK
jgi:hypothetical protein